MAYPQIVLIAFFFAGTISTLVGLPELASCLFVQGVGIWGNLFAGFSKCLLTSVCL